MCIRIVWNVCWVASAWSSGRDVSHELLVVKRVSLPFLACWKVNRNFPGKTLRESRIKNVCGLWFEADWGWSRNRLNSEIKPINLLCWGPVGVRRKQRSTECSFKNLSLRKQMFRLLLLALCLLSLYYLFFFINVKCYT